MTSYAFGASDLAAARLALVAETFDGSSRAFLARWTHARRELAVDLGCGPGFTTRLVAAVLRPVRTVGLDNAPPFLDIARAQNGEGISYVQHDITNVPFPTGLADVLYCRLLLSHLPSPQAVVERWRTQLRPGGLLLLDEVESIETDVPAFARYLALVDAVLANRGTELCVGPRLHAMPGHVSSEIVRVTPPAAVAARMFRMNLESWRDEVADAELVAASLECLTEGMIVWRLRQVAFRREA
jgi:trans-aconitate 2-methyltransferase